MMYKIKISFFIISFICLTCNNYCKASIGDNSHFFQNCIRKCILENCTSGEIVYQYKDHETFDLKIFQWSCKDNCKYLCMWITVDAFKKRNWSIPQFYGKWPFIRFFGIQEPASVLFSLLNLLSHYKHIKYFGIQRNNEPMILLWKMYSMINIHAWAWSAIFHARDTPFTEIMDYICAFSIVTFSFYSAAMRILFGRSIILKILVTLLTSGIFLSHVFYLASGVFDYGYNIFLNAIIGGFGCLLWIMWSLRCIKNQSYCWKVLLYATLIPAVTTLEILDFPPIFWIFDSHSLWHLSTVPLNFLFYSFIMDDIKYLKKTISK